MEPPEKEYLLFCDESDKTGKYFSNFYGGLRIGASNLMAVSERLQRRKDELGLKHELKWEKTDATTVSRHQQMVEAFFDEVIARRVFVRIMFTQNSTVPSGLTSEHYASQYYRLYYQFLKHGFGIRYMPKNANQTRLRIYLDEYQDTEEQISRFRSYVLRLPADEHIRETGLTLAPRDIQQVRSHDHILLQCLDVVLGSITFRLNDKHKAIPEGQHRRGKRTVAKHALYTFIHQQIKRATGKPHFNIGVTTGIADFPVGRWSEPYLHWLFAPKESTYDPTKKKP